MKKRSVPKRNLKGFDAFLEQLKALEIWLDLNVIVQDLKNKRVEAIADTHIGMMKSLKMHLPNFKAELLKHQASSYKNDDFDKQYLEAHAILNRICNKSQKVLSNFEEQQLLSTKPLFLDYEGWKEILKEMM